jgi:hypothetical protein
MKKVWQLMSLAVLGLAAWFFFRPLSTLAKIQQVLPAPQQKDTVTLEDWRTFEKYYRVFVPEEFKAFVATYGCGTVNKTLQVLAPMCLEYKGGLKDQERLLYELSSLLISPPKRILITAPRDNVPNTLTKPEDIVRSWVSDDFERTEEFFALFSQMQQTGQLEPTDTGLALLEKVRGYLVQQYKNKDAAFAKRMNTADLSRISLYTQDISQHERIEDYQEIYEEQLAEFMSKNKQLKGNRFYLWGGIRGTNYDLGWLGKRDEKGLHLRGDKIFLFAKDDFGVLEMGFSEFVLRFLQHDQAIWQRLGFANTEDKAFADKQYQYIANPNRR